MTTPLKTSATDISEPPRQTKNPRKGHSTSTVRADGTLVPWLAASGPLGYSPEEPPKSDRFFRYGPVMPEAFKSPGPHYFGYGYRLSRRDPWDQAGVGDFVDFWDKARTGQVERVCVHLGVVDDTEITSPIACYKYLANRADRRSPFSYMLMQHGSYLLVGNQDQPYIEDGLLVLYRGIGEEKRFCLPMEHLLRLDTEARLLSMRQFVSAQKLGFSDSRVSFRVAHAETYRTETSFVNSDLSWFDLVNDSEIEGADENFEDLLTETYRQSFTLRRELVLRKFGPNYIRCITPINNVRITSFFANEWEVKVVDVRRLQEVTGHGCEVVLDTGFVPINVNRSTRLDGVDAAVADRLSAMCQNGPILKRRGAQAFRRIVAFFQRESSRGFSASTECQEDFEPRA